MVQLSAIIGLLLGLLFRGSLRNITSHKIYWIFLLILSFMMETLVMTGLLYRLTGGSRYFGEIRMTAAVIQYLLVLIFLLKNILSTNLRQLQYAFGLIAAGSMANGLVIVSNFGRMPVVQTIWQLSTASVLKIEQAHHYVLAGEGTRLSVLGDWIPVWSLGWYMVSPGDFLISIGLMIFCFRLTRNGSSKRIKTVEHNEEIVYTNGR
jgi:hypothetical protein